MPNESTAGEARGERIAGSFRDPSGFVFRHQGAIHRQVNECYKDDYDCLMGSGLYEHLVGASLLIPHEEIACASKGERLDAVSPSPEGAYKILKPEMIPFISYPYEWCFSQLKDAALATLTVQKAALKYGMTLRDCTAYNIQFHNGRPVFIDTLSFERYVEGMPWTPYKQFCQHFLAVLAMMSYTDVRLRRLFRVFIDGVPLDLASSLLPYRTRFNIPLLLHLHLHAKSQQRYSDKPIERSGFTHKVSRTALLGLIDSLESAIRKLTWKAAGTEWADYYSDDSYTPVGLEHKQQVVSDYLRLAAPSTVWDLGANTGFHSRLASEMGAHVVAFDVDPACVEKSYLQVVKYGETGILPLVLDLTNPSPSIGWENDERLSILARGPADMAMALALIHHLAISNNVPLGRIAQFFARVCESLVIEFVPKSDHKVQVLLTTREDVFSSYTQEGFEEAFGMFFTIERSERIRESERTMYLMKRRQP